VKESIIIYSFSSIAEQIAQTLQKKNYHVIIVDPEEDSLHKAKKLGYETKRASLMKDENIKKLNLNDKSIKAFFCLSDNKNINLFVTLSVRNLIKDIKIITVSFSQDDNKTILLAGADKIINPYEIGALRIFRLLHKPYILDMLDNILFSESNIEVEEITIPKDSIYDGVFLSELSIIEDCNVILLGLQDKEISDNFIFYSKGIDHKLDAGDTLVVLGESHHLQHFKELIFKI